jgi:hypothetical protein
MTTLTAFFPKEKKASKFADRNVLVLVYENDARVARENRQELATVLYATFFSSSKQMAQHNIYLRTFA